MTRDRMPDLCAARKGITTTTSGGFLKNVHGQIKPNKKLHDLLNNVQEIRELINVMIENVLIVKKIHNDAGQHGNKEIRKELDTRTSTISQLAHRIHGKLKGIGKDISHEDDITFSTARDGSAYNRIRILQYVTLSKSYTETMHDYNENLLKYHDRCANLLKKQRRLVRKHVKSEELDSMLDTEDTNLFVDNILEDTRAAQQQLSDIESRHNELQKLEKSISEVRDIFLEMAILVERQGEQLNCIEYFASKATDDIDMGRDRIIKGYEKKRRLKIRKLKIALAVFVIILIIFIGILCS
ncbi:hypothetical protein TKK_0013259 [Trichogramma kaykai]|uniref:t-SNARE coiled-coil homology domain-containing protein n=1 Tax=Trichogramma kaykai TaxID=54128 RepID=A0ABD2WJ97_9HYME